VMAYVRDGSAVADIGSDHAYLPIELVKRGVAVRALASDVVDGPVERSRTNVASHGMTDLIEVRKADGLCGIEDFAPDDIVIAGMGGELIARIIGDSEYTRNENVRLILQPMTKVEVLRRWLYENGYAIEHESLAFEDGRIYRILCCRCKSPAEPYSEFELLCGRYDDTCGRELLIKHLEETAAHLRARVNGLKVSGRECGDEEKMLCLLTNYITNLKS